MSAVAALLLTATLMATAGIAALVIGRRRGTGLAAVAAAAVLATVAPGLAAFPTPMETSVAAAAAPFVAAFTLGVLAPIGGPGRLALVGAALAGPGRLLLTDPFRDPSCTQGCVPNPLGLTSWPSAAETLGAVGTVLVMIGAGLVARRESQRPSVQVAAVAAGLTALGSPDVLPTLLTLGPLAGACVLAGEVRRGLEARDRVDDLVAALGSGAGDLTGLLRERWGDPDVRIFHRTSTGDYADSRGAPEPEPPGGRQVTEMVAAGEVVTRIHHALALSEAVVMGDELDQQARLALENDRLAADVAVRGELLRAARVRLIQAGDAARRTLERDLHDSAQQHVLALGLELQVAAADPRTDDRTRLVLERCRTETEQALAALRELSHGIYPADLEAGGLTHGLRELVLRAAVPVELTGLLDREPAGDVARTAYALVQNALGRARSPVQVGVRTTGDRLCLHIHGVSDVPTVPLVDRLAALGGTLRTGPGTWEVELPCASS